MYKGRASASATISKKPSYNPRGSILLLRLSILAVFALIAAQTLIGAQEVAAEGEATGLAVESQTCTPGFTVQVVLSWTPSGAGQQWVDISLLNDGFTAPYIHGGPFNASRSEATVNNLEAQRNYYVRVSTWCAARRRCTPRPTS